MTSIIDPTPEQAGNPQDALKAASEAANERASTTTTTDTTTTKVTIPEKFKGKSLEDIVAAYQNLESQYGRLTSEVGQTRQTVDLLLQQKRENDLRGNGGRVVQEPKEPELTAADLLENPKQALNSYLEHRESATTKELRQRLAQQEAQLQHQSFIGRHPDWQQHTNDPAFIEWAKQTPYRTNLATQAAQNNLAAADALLSEYKAYKPLLSQSTSQSTNLEAARKVGLERTTTSGDTESKPKGKIIYRRDAQALRISDPDKYESPAFQNELLRAISEDRYM